MPPSIIAIVVTFNRKELLVKCLEGLLVQSVSLQKIIVVDNASSDGTGEFLDAAGYLATEKISYHRLAENLGGAGGFNFGLAKAREASAEWYWLMDDDVVPDAECLGALLAYSAISECIHPHKLLKDGREHFAEMFFDISTAKATILPNPSFLNGKDYCVVNVGCFEGMLVSRRVVDLIGLPDPKYFISWDDTLYGVKASAHTNVIVARQAVLQKTLGEREVTPWKMYYIVRNRYYIYGDLLEYFGIRPCRADTFSFHAARLADVVQAIRKGPKFIWPVIRGSYHGWQYLREQRRRQFNAPAEEIMRSSVRSQ